MLHLRRVQAFAVRLPGWAWLALAGWLVGPWLLRYWVWALGGCVEFFVPRR